MAGFIHLSSGKGLSISSRSFDSIVEKPENIWDATILILKRYMNH